MLNISTTSSSSEIHLGDLHLFLTEGASGAPAVIAAFDPDSDRFLHEDADEGWSS